MKNQNYTSKPPSIIEIKHDREWGYIVTETRLATDEDISSSNAHLISSAPDLLSALRFLLADYIAIEGDKLTGSSVPIEMAQAAISKAEGLK